MSDNLITIGQVQAYWNSSSTRILKYACEMYHNGLNEHKLISAPEIDMLNNKADLQSQKWTEQWEKIKSKRQSASAKVANIEEASVKTQEAIEYMRLIDSLLIRALSIDVRIDWESLKKNAHYHERRPLKPLKPEKYELISPAVPPVFTFIDNIFKSRREKKIQEVERKIQEIERLNQEIERLNQEIDKKFDDEMRKWQSHVVEWEKRKNDFLQKQDDFNTKIDQMKKAYLNKNNDSIIEYSEMVLNNSEYPDSFPQNFELEYNSDNKILIIEYELPTVVCFPKVKEVKYIATRKELKESYISEAQVNKMFDDAMYKITLRTLYELFKSDVANAIEAVSFNGWVKSINKATGKEENNCILSIQVQKCEFSKIDLSNVDSKICFKNLKGVASSKLNSLTPVQPILQISKVDKRFVESYDVTNQIDNTTNLAAMDWEDFEHLIRELFEKEFQTSGGEVKVTQASRDGGVDAIAFDPDPIRGGKIVIQAKRYTNTVGVSAVRDLYGTLLNEGATKGILVSTADYGPDSYEFAKSKPLTLLNGSNLLYLLEKHGHHAKIDLREAKKILAERYK